MSFFFPYIFKWVKVLHNKILAFLKSFFPFVSSLSCIIVKSNNQWKIYQRCSWNGLATYHLSVIAVKQIATTSFCLPLRAEQLTALITALCLSNHFLHFMQNFHSAIRHFSVLHVIASHFRNLGSSGVLLKS